jgi:CheY-like chemotaxis protein
MEMANYPPTPFNSALWPVTRLFFASLAKKLEKAGKHKPVSDDHLNLSVLVADDDEDDRLLFEEAVEKIHPVIKVQSVENGYELLAAMREGNLPEIIFLDLNMPGKNGRDCLKEIRQHNKWNKVPIVIYSTSSSQKDISETFRDGANLYLIKPNSFPDLIKMIKATFHIDWESNTELSESNFVLTTKNV